MDGIKTATEPPQSNGTRTTPTQPREGRKRRWEMTADNIRYFLPKPGSSDARPELGREMSNECDALVEAFKSGQVMFTLVAWRAVPEMNGGAPVIVKQAVART